MKTIILPTDFSKNSKNAINWALAFFKDTKANFVIINSYKAPKTSTGSLMSITDILHKQSLDELAEFKEEIMDENPGMLDRIETIAYFGDVLESVNAVTREAGDYSVVVGAKGMTAMKELLIGSNTSELILHLKQPLYVIPENFKHIEFKQVALALDLKDDINMAVFSPLKEDMQHTSAHLFPFYIKDEKPIPEENVNDAIKALQEYFNDNNISIANLSNENPKESIKNFIREKGIDCLVSVNKKRSFFQRFFHKSFSKDLAGHTDTVLLILHD